MGGVSTVEAAASVSRCCVGIGVKSLTQDVGDVSVIDGTIIPLINWIRIHVVRRGIKSVIFCSQLFVSSATLFFSHSSRA